LTATIIKGLTEIIDKVGMQFSFGMQFNLIKHAWKVDETINSLVGAS
jgi:hypothetical protein